MADIEKALRESLDANALRVTSNRGGYPGHLPVPSADEDIEALAKSLAARLSSRPVEADPRDKIIENLKVALRVATHSPHDQDGEPVEGFPVCSICGAIQTEAEEPISEMEQIEDDIEGRL